MQIPQLELTSVNPGEPVFVELPQLPVGRHNVHVSATSTAGETAPLGELDIVMRIRERGASSQGPLFIHRDPPVPTLEELWEGGRADISLQGPSGRNVKCRVSLFERDGETATISKQLPQIGMPFTAGDWRAHFEKHCQDPKNAQEKKKTQEAYDISHICRLEFDADELGAFTVCCERAFTPLRWALRRHGSRQILRLLDDSGDPEQPVVSRMAFETPCIDESLAPALEYQVPNSGGMYVARAEKFNAAIIVLPSSVREFADLRYVPHIEKRQRSLTSVIRAVEIAGLWSRARLPGDIFSMKRQRDVVGVLVREVFCLLCGEKWAKAEEKIISETGTLEDLSRAVSKHQFEADIGAILLRNVETLSRDTCKSRIHLLASFTKKYHLLKGNAAPTGIDSPKWFAEFSLRLASDPAGVETWADQYLHSGLGRLLEKPTLARAARFLIIATDIHLQQKTTSRELYTSWRWT